jgi:hypothetical protein
VATTTLRGNLAAGVGQTRVGQSVGRIRATGSPFRPVAGVSITWKLVAADTSIEEGSNQ